MTDKAIIKVGSDGIQLADFNSMQRFCAAAVQSRMFSGISDVSQAIMKVEYGMELGLKPITAMRNIYYFNGTFCLSAAIINALIKRSGYRIKTVERSKKRCILEFFDPGKDSMGIAEYTWEDATEAKFTGKDNWRKFPKNMLYARCLTMGANMYCAEVFLGAVYTPEEIIESQNGRQANIPNVEILVSEDEPREPPLPEDPEIDLSPEYEDHMDQEFQTAVETLKGKISRASNAVLDGDGSSLSKPKKKRTRKKKEEAA